MVFWAEKLRIRYKIIIDYRENQEWLPTQAIWYTRKFINGNTILY